MPLSSGTGQYAVPNASGGFMTTVSNLTNATPTTAHEALIQIGLELVAVAVTAVIADTGPKAGHAMVALWVLLWVVYLMTRA